MIWSLHVSCAGHALCSALQCAGQVVPNVNILEHALSVKVMLQCSKIEED